VPGAARARSHVGACPARRVTERVSATARNERGAAGGAGFDAVLDLL
jgi:hypothetical protein